MHSTDDFPNYRLDRDIVELATEAAREKIAADGVSVTTAVAMATPGAWARFRPAVLKRLSDDNEEAGSIPGYSLDDSELIREAIADAQWRMREESLSAEAAATMATPRDRPELCEEVLCWLLYGQP